MSLFFMRHSWKIRNQKTQKCWHRRTMLGEQWMTYSGLQRSSSPTGFVHLKGREPELSWAKKAQKNPHNPSRVFVRVPGLALWRDDRRQPMIILYHFQPRRSAESLCYSLKKRKAWWKLQQQDQICSLLNTWHFTDEIVNFPHPSLSPSAACLHISRRLRWPSSWRWAAEKSSAAPSTAERGRQRPGHRPETEASCECVEFKVMSEKFLIDGQRWTHWQQLLCSMNNRLP